jgi:hypothetical protein
VGDAAIRVTVSPCPPQLPPSCARDCPAAPTTACWRHRRPLRLRPRRPREVPPPSCARAVLDRGRHPLVPAPAGRGAAAHLRRLRPGEGPPPRPESRAGRVRHELTMNWYTSIWMARALSFCPQGQFGLYRNTTGIRHLQVSPNELHTSIMAIISKFNNYNDKFPIR